MVVTRLREITAKGQEWVAASSASPTTSNQQPNVSTSSSSSSSATAVAAADTQLPSTSYWEYATHSLHGAAASAIGGMVSSFYGSNTTTTANYGSHQHQGGGESSHSFFNRPFFFSGAVAAPIVTKSRRLGAIDEYDDDDDDDGDDDGNDNEQQQRRKSALPLLTTTPSRIRRSATSHQTAHSDLVWMFRHDKNPYNAVRGRDDAHMQSLTAVRSLVALMVNVPTASTTREEEEEQEDDSSSAHRRPSWQRTTHAGVKGDDVTEVGNTNASSSSWSRSQSKTSNNSDEMPPPPPPPPYNMSREHSLIEKSKRSNNTMQSSVSSPSETASQLAEGTIRALRDLALDEAVELQAALRYWNNRWERPLLSWLEAGPLGMYASCLESSPLSVCSVLFDPPPPRCKRESSTATTIAYHSPRRCRSTLCFSLTFLFYFGSFCLSTCAVWTSEHGYNHQEIGRKVSQIQAVLARRCAAVGELQQHLLRAGWHRGVAQWGGTSTRDFSIYDK